MHTWCDSVNHWADKCPDKYPEKVNSKHAYSDGHITLFQGNHIQPSKLKGLVAESWNHGVLDSGANKTCSGLLWLECFLQSLSEEDLKTVTYHKPEGGFVFGDSHVVMAEKAVTIPIYIGRVRVTMYVAVVDYQI